MPAPDRPWPADRTERRPVASLIAYARNARTHSDEQVSEIAASIKEWGWTIPVLVDEAGQIIAGHGRVLAAKKLGITDVPVMVAVGWTEAQKHAYCLADNKIALNAGWDLDLLKVELAELNTAEFDIGMTGFSDRELKALFEGAASGGGEGGDDDKPAKYQILITCRDEKHQREVIKTLQTDGHDCRALIS